MLPPSELKNKTFTHVIRGYSSIEVDEHIAFIIEKYTELYRENDALERKIAAMQAEIDKFRNDEESIRSALVNAHKASSQILKEANERSEIILRSAKQNCDKILSEFKSAAKEERDELLMLRRMVKTFKEDLFVEYNTHIEMIERIAPELDNLDEDEFADEAIVRLAVESIKNDIITGAVAQDEEDTEVALQPETGNDETEKSNGADSSVVATDEDISAADSVFNGEDDKLDDKSDDKAADEHKSIDLDNTPIVSEKITYDMLLSETENTAYDENIGNEEEKTDNIAVIPEMESERQAVVIDVSDKVRSADTGKEIDAVFAQKQTAESDADEQITDNAEYEKEAGEFIDFLDSVTGADKK